eukprot:TRINITY_DN15819_c1_g1_i1.p1 TRINITY_DN15819_c1_g1~~TRINITY_DN15819_c1_g1_i1.p1  ORF type:complete len:610 (+),score=109.99 TRINITY_DN15819_c1_g1_i1:74-1903(+)
MRQSEQLVFSANQIKPVSRCRSAPHVGALKPLAKFSVSKPGTAISAINEGGLSSKRSNRSSSKHSSSKSSKKPERDFEVNFSGHLAEGILFVAKGAIARGSINAAAWEPFHFTHHKDGSLSFKAVHSPQDPSSDTNAAPRTLEQPQELYLDADWEQPFLVAPWKPLQSQGQQLYPFSLSYALRQDSQNRQQMGLLPPEATMESSFHRKSLVLASTDKKSRDSWLLSFARKSQQPALRRSNSVLASRGSEASGGWRSAGLSAAAECRRFSALGETHNGLSLNRSTPALPKLGPARPDLWEGSSSLFIVKELYDGYAADPLTASVPFAYGKTKASKGSLPMPGFLTEISTGADKTKKQQKQNAFFSSYLEKQAKIETLLEQKRSEPVSATSTPVPSADEVQIAEAEVALQDDADAEEEVDRLSKPFEVIVRTPNTLVEGDVLTNVEWSGGVLFDPPNVKSFHLSICQTEPLTTNPIFIGIAPLDVDLTQVNLFDCQKEAGVFLCVGGQASATLMGALGAPAGPVVYAFGERRVQEKFPALTTGATIELDYQQVWHKNGDVEGCVAFTVSDEEGVLHRTKPKLCQKIDPFVDWRPCLLMCVPESHVRVNFLR